MNRLLAGLLGVGLAAALIIAAAPAAAQERGPLSTAIDLADLDVDPGRNRDGREVAQGEDGDTIIYTSVETPGTIGGATTDVTPAPPDLSRVPVESEEPAEIPVTDEPAPAPVTTAPPAGTVAETTTAAAPAAEPAVTACPDFASWYDAQVFYENAGGTAAPAEMVGSLDPDVDGFACEEMVEY